MAINRPQRRRLLTALTAVLLLGTVLAAGPSAGAPPPIGTTPPLSAFTEQLPIPPVVDATAGGTIDLETASTEHTFHAGLPATDTFGYALTKDGEELAATYLGPTIEARRDVPVTLEARSTITTHPAGSGTGDARRSVIDLTLHGAEAEDRTDPRLAVHKHGGHTEREYDGLPTQVFTREAREPHHDIYRGDVQGEYPTTRTYEYENDQDATTLWYHDHGLGITRLNVFAGLAGFYLLRDDLDTGEPGNPAGLPAGEDSAGNPVEIPLALQDRMFNADGTFEYPLGPFAGTPEAGQPVEGTDLTYPDQWSPEFFGDVAVVNGKVWPNHDVDRGLYRFRILNGSNARFYNLRLVGGEAAMYQVGTDGGLLDAPVRTSRLLIAPGERADVVIDFRAALPGSRIRLVNDARAPFPSGPRAARQGGVPLANVMRFSVGSQSLPGTLPPTLRPAGAPPAAPALPAPARTRTIFLNEILDPATGAPLEVLLNNLPFDIDEDQQETPQANTVERWDIVNVSADTHPIHLHLVQFQVQQRQRLDAAGYLGALNTQLRDAGLIDPACAGLPDPCAAEQGPPFIQDGTRVDAPSPAPFLRGQPTAAPANERGWKDTVQAHPGEVTRIVVPFSGGVDPMVPFGREERFTGDYVWHCHILDHEDHEMMLSYRVTQ
jgi:spore coat protein A, manganese oxidase